MNVCIVTLYNSENCGSYYQAYALSKVLQTMGHNVYFLKRDAAGTSHNLYRKWFESAKAALHGHIRSAVENMRRYYAFETALKNFCVIDSHDPQFLNIDCFVIGSDTVWNFEVPYFRNRKNTYIGNIFNKKKITYAFSLANTPYETIYNDNEIVNGIRHLDAVSVRDQYTCDCVKPLLNHAPVIVPDPTLLLNETDYSEKEEQLGVSDYILIYGFKAVSKETVEKLKKMGKTIVSYGIHRKWADINVIFDPNTFLSYFHNAAYVITDTFHGTMFSIIYKKKFLCYGTEKKKVVDLLERFGLYNRILNDEGPFVNLLEQDIDYESIDEKISGLRQCAIDYLTANL